MRNVIFMPTRGRVDDQVTLHLLPKQVKRDLIIACHPGEEEALFDDWGEQVHDIWPVEASHIGEVRQYCIEKAPCDIITFVDDRLDFHARVDSVSETETKFSLKGIIPKHFPDEKLRHRYIYQIFAWIRSKLDSGKYGMAGISRRSGNNTVDADEVENVRICSFWGINRKLFTGLKGNPSFADMQLKEDFYITLHFLTNGIPTISSYKYAYGRAGGSNTKGGCSIYRKVEASNKSAFQLKEHFPNFVNIRNKSTKSWNGEFGDRALDVTIQWKKAYQFGVQKKQNKMLL